MAIADDIKLLGLQRCEFDDECDHCNNPQGGSWVSMFVCEGVSEADYYICAKCIPKKARDFNENLEHWIAQIEAETTRPEVTHER